MDAFKHDLKSDLCLQEQSDQYVLEWLAQSGPVPPVCNLAVSMLRIVQRDLSAMAYLPPGHARRHLEAKSSPASARTCFAALGHLDATRPNRVIGLKKDPS